MSLLEVCANLLTVLSVVLSVRLKKALYPVGLVATALFWVVFWQAKLYASAALQIYFTAVQLYGWWFWSRGDRGREPPVGDWSWPIVGLAFGCAAALTFPLAWAVERFTDAHMALADTAILVLSVLAQFLLDRKQLKTWFVWGLVDAISIYVYTSQKLWLTGAVYAVLLINVAFGWRRWRAALLRPVGAVEAA